MSRNKIRFRPEARRAAIFDIVERGKRVSVEFLAERLDTSVETVRRDLNVLANSGHIRKIHGGAVRLSSLEESAFGERAKHNTLAKQLIAEKLVGIISPGQSLFLDTGTTTLTCAKAISRIPDLVVITNSALIAAAVSGKDNGAKTTLLGGTYRHDNAQTIGPTTIAEIGQFRTDHAVLTVGTLDANGASDFSEGEASVARAMIGAASHVTVVADCSKLNRRSTYQVCGLDQIDTLILDQEPDAELREVLQSANVEIL